MVNAYLAQCPHKINATKCLRESTKKHEPSHYIRQIEDKLDNIYEHNTTDTYLTEMAVNNILEGQNRQDPYKLTLIRTERMNNEDYDLRVDVVFERLIVQAIRNQLEKGSDHDYTLLILENL